MNIRLKQTPGIYIVGFMAAGKTTIGRRLADELGWGFADLDDDIEAAQGAKIAEIFADLGEPEFRRLETAALQARVCSIERGNPTVLALGGGAFVHPGNFELVENHGVTLWLDCPLEIVKRRVAQTAHRPLAHDPVRLETLYHDRRDLYHRADFHIAIDSDDPAVALAAILGLPIFR